VNVDTSSEVGTDNRGLTHHATKITRMLEEMEFHACKIFQFFCCQYHFLRAREEFYKLKKKCNFESCKILEQNKKDDLACHLFVLIFLLYCFITF